MNSIEFEAQFTNETKKVQLVSNTYGGNGYQVLINNFYQGEIFYRDGTWQAHLNDRSFLTSDDIAILSEVIEKKIEG